MSQLELEQLIDAWIEQSITQDQFAHLEQTLLHSSEARLIYLRCIQLHGLLHYHAAMKGDCPEADEILIPTFSECTQPADSKSLFDFSTTDSESRLLSDLYEQAATDKQQRSPRWSPVQKVIAMVAGLLIVVGILAVQPNTTVEVVDNNSPTEQTLPVEPADPTLVANDPQVTTISETSRDPLPEIHFPSVTHNTPAQETQPVVAQPNAVSNPDQNAVAGSFSVVAEINNQLKTVWEENEVTPSPVVDDALWYRRLSLDLLGIPPQPEQLAKFVASTQTDKHQKLVDELLTQPAYTRHLVDQWTTLLVGRLPSQPVDRDKLSEYLTVSFHENRPWSQIVTDLITAEGDPSEVGEANYLAAHLNNQAVPATAITSRLFLGQQLACVQCHAHPFHEQTQETFWSFHAFFESTKLVRSENMQGSGWQLVSENTAAPTYYETRSGLMKVAYPQYKNQKIEPDHSVNRRNKLAQFLINSQSQDLAMAFVNRRWENFLGRGFTSPVDDIGPHNPPCHPELMALLTREFISSGYDIRLLTKWIVLSDAYRRSSEITEKNEIDQPEIGEIPLFSRVYPKSLTAEQVYDSLNTIGGTSQRLLSSTSYLDRREDWVTQFIKSAGDDENCEQEHFEGSLTQALNLMNGEVVQDLLDPRQNEPLAEIMSSSKPLAVKLSEVCLLTLSREPNEKEKAFFKRLQRQAPADKASIIQDVLWAYLNSGEFVTNY